MIAAFGGEIDDDDEEELDEDDEDEDEEDDEDEDDEDVDEVDDEYRTDRGSLGGENDEAAEL